MRGQERNKRRMIKNGGLKIDQASIRINNTKLAILKNTALGLKIIR